MKNSSSIFSSLPRIEENHTKLDILKMFMDLNKKKSQKINNGDAKEKEHLNRSSFIVSEVNLNSNLTSTINLREQQKDLVKAYSNERIHKKGFLY